MNYLENYLIKQDRADLEKALELLDGLKLGFEGDEKFAKEQHQKCSLQKRVTLASAQRREEAKMIMELATYRVDKCCEARHALRGLLGACSKRSLEAAA